MLQKCPKYSFSDNIISKHRLIISYFLSGKNVFHKKMLLPKCSTLFSKSIFLLFHCPHLFNQRLFFLSADCPNRQDQLHSEQYQNEQTYFQNREFVRHYISGKSSYTHFSASKDGSRKPNDQRRQCCKERIAQPLTDVHFT